MHIADFGIGMLGANGIVAGGIAIVTGAGLAAQMDGKGRVAVSFFGDGASNAGPFHECLNIAATWKLPMLYVCENNLYAAQTAAADDARHAGRRRRAPPATAFPASSSTATTSSPSIRPPAAPSSARGPARARR